MEHILTMYSSEPVCGGILYTQHTPLENITVLYIKRIINHNKYILFINDISCESWKEISETNDNLPAYEFFIVHRKVSDKVNIEVLMENMSLQNTYINNLNKFHSRKTEIVEINVETGSIVSGNECSYKGCYYVSVTGRLFNATEMIFRKKLNINKKTRIYIFTSKNGGMWVLNDNLYVNDINLVYDAFVIKSSLDSIIPISINALFEKIKVPLKQKKSIYNKVADHGGIFNTRAIYNSINFERLFIRDVCDNRWKIIKNKETFKWAYEIYIPDSINKSSTSKILRFLSKN